MKQKFSFRKIINKAHLWVGLPSALILFVVCLSGTIYVFNKEITRWVDSDKFYVQPGDTVMSTSNLISLVENEHKGFRVSAITIAAAKDEAWMFALAEKKKKDENKAMGKKGKPQREKLTNYLVDPYTGNIQGNAQTTTSEFFNTVMQLHRWLLLEHDLGSVITGVAAFLFLFLELSGLVLWLPHKIRSWKRWNAWKPGFKIKTNAHVKRVNYDLHRAIGFYTFFLITIMAVTGPIFGFEWYKKAFNTALGVKTPARGEAPEGSKKKIDSLLKPLSPDEWIVKADSVYNYKGELRINLPKDRSSVVTFIKWRAGFAASAGTDRLVLNQYSNEIINIEKFSDKRFTQKVSSLAKAIHTGEVFGAFSKILYFAACLFATSLPVTGVFIWINKRRKKHISV